MCGIIVSSLEIPEKALYFVKRRGPDNTNIVKYGGLNFIHFLLQITGEPTLQPLIEDDICIIFNGEIYNYKEIYPEAKSDAYSILHSYKKYGSKFVHNLDGDFTVVIVDFKKNRLYICCDVFATKPIYYSINEKHIIISSYPTSIRDIEKEAKPLEHRYNQLSEFDLTSRKLIQKIDVYSFDLNQYKDTYDDFNKSLEEAILKRYPEKSVPILNLSSGMDSGIISCVLNKHKKEAIYVTFPKNENMGVIRARNKILNDKIILMSLGEGERKRYKFNLEKNCEDFCWDWRWIPAVGRIDPPMEASSMLAKSKTLEFIRKKYPKIKVCYSGIGPDEIMNKAKYYCHGVGNPKEFPKDLESIFPWKNFYEGTMKNYIKGDEYVGGCYGFENRFPYCDKKLVQEFLWLKPELKNSYKGHDQKAPLVQYLIEENYPFHDMKMGFNV